MRASLPHPHPNKCPVAMRPLTSSSTVAAVSASPSRLRQGKALSTVSTARRREKGGHRPRPPNTLSAHGPPIPTLTVDVPAAPQVPHDLAAGQVAVEVLGRGRDMGRPAQTAPGPKAVPGVGPPPSFLRY